METNAANYRSRPKTPDQMNKKRNPDNKWRSQSKDRYTPKTDTDTEMTDASPPTSSGKTGKQEQPKRNTPKGNTQQTR